MAATSMRKRIERPADTPPEVYDYWHQRWVEYLNKNCKERFVEAGVVDVSFTEKCPDCPDGSGAFHYQFASDGTLEFTHHEGGAIIEYDSYDIGYRLLGDANYDAMEQLENGSIRYSKNLEDFVKLAELLPLMREALYVAIADAENKFNIEMPKYQ
jgi:hypothetical protein